MLQVGGLDSGPRLRALHSSLIHYLSPMSAQISPARKGGLSATRRGSPRLHPPAPPSMGQTPSHRAGPPWLQPPRPQERPAGRLVLAQRPASLFLPHCGTLFLTKESRQDKHVRC